MGAGGRDRPGVGECLKMDRAETTGEDRRRAMAVHAAVQARAGERCRYGVAVDFVRDVKLP